MKIGKKKTTKKWESREKWGRKFGKIVHFIWRFLESEGRPGIIQNNWKNNEIRPSQGTLALRNLIIHPLVLVFSWVFFLYVVYFWVSFGETQAKKEWGAADICSTPVRLPLNRILRKRRIK